MDAPTPPSISSFVIRFVVDPSLDAYRGEIRHIQTSEEIHFDAWPEAVEFIRRYVPLEMKESPPESPRSGMDRFVTGP